MTARKRLLQFALRWANAITALSLFTAGCQNLEDFSLTYHVWGGEMSSRRVSAPAPEPHIALFEVPAKSDFLVAYDALNDASGNVNRRAYLLQENQFKISNGKKPKFLDPALAKDLKPVEIVKASTESMTATNASPAVIAAPPVSELHAVLTPDNQHFKLVFDAEHAETFQLPIYVETGGKTLQIIATPFAVAGDTVMVAAFIAAIGALAWLECGAPH